MEIKLFESELKVMEILWEEGEATAKRIAERCAEAAGWSKTTTYTVIKKCIDKGAIERRDPNFRCVPLISRADAQRYETRELIDRMYGGAPDRLMAALLSERTLSREEIGKLRALIEKLEG